MTLRRRTVLLAAVAAAGSAGASACSRHRDPPPATPPSAFVPESDTQSTDYTVTELAGPARTQLRRRADQAVMATFTVGSRTAVLAGPRRRFTDPTYTTAVIDSTSWVRLLPRPWRQGDHSEQWFVRWLRGQISGKPKIDVLAAALQYLQDEPIRRDKNGVRYAGDAGFGYVHTADERDGADFFDYLGIPWRFPDARLVRPSGRWNRKLDCSGYIRLVYGYRFGIPLFNKSATSTVDGLPRTAASMAAHARSVVIAAGDDPSRPPKDLSAIAPGDLTFFALHEDPALITHSGIYLGADTDGHLRFVSSRGTVDGPSFGDVRGDGYIDAGYFGLRLRRIIRL